MSRNRIRPEIEAPAPIAPGMAPLAPLPELRTIEEVHAALAELDFARLEAAPIIAGEKEIESSLIDADADDQEFLKLTMKVRAARRQLVRLDRREQQILLQAQKIEDARRQARWTVLRAEYIDKAARLAAVAAIAEQLRQEVIDISQQSLREGFGGPLGPVLPSIYGHMPWIYLWAPHNAAQNIPEMAPPGEGLSLGPASLVRMVAPFGNFGVGSIYSLPAQRALWLREQGLAEPVETSPFGAGVAPEALRVDSHGRAT